MDFSHSPKAEELLERLQAFMEEHIYPNEKTYKEEQAAMTDRWQPVPVVERLKPVARAAGLWNLFLPHSDRGAGLSNVDYAPLAEAMGRVMWSSEVFNCSAPDTGNMETIDRYGTAAQKEEWLEPLLRGEIRSCFCMTEPDVASSDATNIQCTITRDGGDYVINGRKWWSSGSGDPRCKIFIVMGKTDPDGPDKHRQQSMILVPADTAGVKIERMLPVFGYDDAPAWARRDQFHQRPRAGGEHPARRGPRLRDRAGAAWAGPHPSLHAGGRVGRAGAGDDVQAAGRA